MERLSAHTRAISFFDGRKIQKRIENEKKNSCSVEATGKSKLSSTIIKYSVVDCLDVSTCSNDFFHDSHRIQSKKKAYNTL